MISTAKSILYNEIPDEPQPLDAPCFGAAPGGTQHKFAAFAALRSSLNCGNSFPTSQARTGDAAPRLYPERTERNGPIPKLNRMPDG